MIRNVRLLRIIGINPKTIIHIGASKGQDREQYVRLGVTYIYWGEASKTLAINLAKSFPADKVIWGAFTNKNNGEKKLYVSPSGTIGSRKLKIHKTNFISPRKTLDKEFSKLDLEKPILLVVDTDGAEFEVLEGGKNFIKQVKWLVIEQYWSWDGGQWHKKLTKLAKDSGFRRVFGRVSYTNDYEDVLYTKSGIMTVLFSRIMDKSIFVIKQIKHVLVKGHVSSTYFHCFKCD